MDWHAARAALEWQVEMGVTETISDAEREAQIVRGEADATRNRVYAEAYGADREFFAFYRSLEAYQKSLRTGNSAMVMTPNSEFFDYLRSANPEQ